jgi:hypothetical protein
MAGDTRTLDEVAKEYLGVDEKGRIADPDLRQRIIKHMMEYKSLRLMQQRMLDETKAGQGPSEFTSVAKNARARIQQERRGLHTDRTRHHASVPVEQGHDDLLRHD